MKWGEGLNNQHEVGGEGWWREINDGVDDCRRGGVVQVRGKGWQEEDNGDHCRRRSRAFMHMNAPPNTTKFQDLPRQTAMPDPPLHGEEVSGEG
jgi:hypothetical protein